MLIWDNGFLSTVKHLVFENCTEHPKFMLIIADAFSLAKNDSDSLSALTECCDIYDRGDGRMNKELDTKCRRAIKKFAWRTAIALPNVKTLDLSVNECHEYVLMYAAELINYYGKQLVSLKLFCAERISGPIALPRLERLSIMFHPINRPLSFTVDPHSLNSIDIIATNLDFFWRAFTRDPDGALRFPNLKTLSFNYPDISRRGHEERNYEAPPSVLFPKLERLVIRGYDENIRDFKLFVCPSLTSIEICGRWATVLELCKQLTVPLDLLQLTIDPMSRARIVDCIEDMNTLFQSIRNIKVVDCLIDLDLQIDLSILYWPNLTHLVLRVDNNLANVLNVLPRIPDLVYLEIEFVSYDAVEIAETIDTLNHLKRTGFPPVESNVKSLHIVYFSDSHMEEFVHAAQNLRCSLPNLKAFNVCSKYQQHPALKFI
ncbi:hypothetical protein IWW55_000575 [Coemansia sp. RSA 2706]|nr:hypothetical protein LPJ63_004960 [Coemansia sp. RSA 2711]KAJ2308211.1 hypothetical protein IWW55_000575 [Coemansia sp. RSA 2706]KAJ2313881.1 hypothetical protein IWW54_001247 [Coemansia sp. RSA 2705]KAJ2320268.1 hypothetical protein IWW52_001476 [Coemansia sp. RSA 2704]KAJ2370639.1 hypothetical protein H4S01_000194 [Coemansia sp. RSA 2610]KAJ2738654.1 hypothetical protein H4R23_001000 [Coemansia sp. Cherry 401B]